MNADSQNLLREWKRLKLIESSFRAWCQVALPEGQSPDALHHRLIVDKLQAVADGKIRRLMLILPPGSAKSTYASWFFPLWYITKANRIILACSHSAELAASFGRKCRNLVELKQRELGYTLSSDSRAADKWAVSNGSEYYCAGVGTGIAGRRADLGLIDDPVGSREIANSKIERDKMWNWYEDDFIPRVKPGCPVILIQTRWHEDDLAGRLIAREASEWDIVHIPFIAMDNDILGRVKGQVLWPEWFEKSDDAKKDVEKAKKSGAFSSLYQGQPAPEEGDEFKWEWMQPALYHTMDQLPKDLRIYVASDHALTEKQKNDANCLIPFGVDANDDIWILPDVWWKRSDTGELVEEMVNMAERRKPVDWFAEDEHIRKGIGPFLNKRMQERKVYFIVTPLTSSRDLVQRCGSIKGRMKQYKIHFPAFASWWHQAKHEMLMFPNGTHDDFVAALSKIGQGLDNINRPSLEAPETPEDFTPKEFRPTFGWLKELDKKARRPLVPRYGDR